MKGFVVAFIVIREYENLGVGYMAALLSKEGYSTRVIDFRKSKKNILRILKRVKPDIVGFSVVYQYNIDKFKELVHFLRQNGIKSHFTAGGHYASVKYEELAETVPSLDSVIRSEGEYTLLELAECLNNGKEWRNIRSLVYRNDGKLVANPLRPLEKNLDILPFPKRASLTKYVFNRKFATLIASRGCIYDCSFCNLKEFYRFQKSSSKRYRSPESVVMEMEYLYKRRNCKVFLFQDDDFPISFSDRSDWIFRFSKHLCIRGLDKKIIWKINCRPDEVNSEVFSILKNIGLFLVFLGIEDGTDTGLRILNKHISAQKNLEGVEILKNLKIGIDYGFLLFQPETTFNSLNQNIDFLQKICGDGYTPATFLKLMPYYETSVEKQLIKERRIKGPPGYRDYDFHEVAMNQYFDFITGSTLEWIRDPQGIVNLSKWARNFFLVHDHFYFYRNDTELLRRDFNKIMSECNNFLLNSMKELANTFESGGHLGKEKKLLENYTNIINQKHDYYRKEITGIISRLKVISFAYECMSI